jgi:TrmH family RNA methyltransferase
MNLKKHKNILDYSYSLGMAPTLELLGKRKEQVKTVYIHPEYECKDPSKNIFEICEAANVRYEIGVKAFNKLADKDNTYVIGVFNKYSDNASNDAPHAVLANPSDAGNLGTIIRTGLGFGFGDFVIIRPGVDIFDPKTIRSSMGAAFHARFSRFETFADYMHAFPNHKLYPFMLNGKSALDDIAAPHSRFSIVFGNEATGLPNEFLTYGESVRIEHNSSIDSLNLSIAFGIAAYKFSKDLRTLL